MTINIIQAKVDPRWGFFWDTTPIMGVHDIPHTEGEIFNPVNADWFFDNYNNKTIRSMALYPSIDTDALINVDWVGIDEDNTLYFGCVWVSEAAKVYLSRH